MSALNSPVPGLFTQMLSWENASPAAIGAIDTMDAYANSMVGVSSNKTSLLPPVAVQIISDPDNGDGFDIESPRDMVLDQTNNRVLIADTDLQVIRQVALDSGDREVLISSTVGGGSGFLTPKDLTLDQNTKQLWVTDAQSNSLVRKDLVSGSVTIISSPDVGTGPVSGMDAIAQDDANNRFLISSSRFSGLVITVEPVSGLRAI